MQQGKDFSVMNSQPRLFSNFTCFSGTLAGIALRIILAHILVH